MASRNRFSWSNQSQEGQLHMARNASRGDLRLMARAFDWGHDDMHVLNCIMANKSVDLASALAVFFNGDPARFNYLSKREVPKAHRQAVKLLDNICLRINSGFYRVSNTVRLENRQRLDRWLMFQKADRTEGRRGRWILDEDILTKVLVRARPVTEIRAVAELRPQEAALVENAVGSFLRRHMGNLKSDIAS